MLERARAQIAALAATTAEIEAALPSRVGDAVQDGIRAEVIPVARHIAEVRGLMNNLIRRIEGAPDTAPLLRLATPELVVRRTTAPPPPS